MEAAGIGDVRDVDFLTFRITVSVAADLDGESVAVVGGSLSGISVLRNCYGRIHHVRRIGWPLHPKRAPVRNPLTSQPYIYELRLCCTQNH